MMQDKSEDKRERFIVHACNLIVQSCIPYYMQLAPSRQWIGRPPTHPHMLLEQMVARDRVEQEATQLLEWQRTAGQGVYLAELVKGETEDQARNKKQKILRWNNEVSETIRISTPSVFAECPIAHIGHEGIQPRSDPAEHCELRAELAAVFYEWKYIDDWKYIGDWRYISRTVLFRTRFRPQKTPNKRCR